MTANAPLTFGATSGPCAVCGAAGPPCDRCGVDFYCSEAHKEKDRARHSKGCDCLEVEDSAELGRCLVAKKDIPANTMIMRELPLLLVPQQDSLTVTAVCVGCCRDLAERDVRGCALCGWPVCGERCARRAAHQVECAAFQRAGFKVGGAWKQGLHVWQALTGLRFALAPEEKKAALMGLQATLSEPNPEDLQDQSARKFFSGIRAAQDCLSRQAVDWLLGTVGISWIDGDEIKRGLAVMAINSFGADAPDHKAAVAMKGISLLEHACLPNTSIMTLGNEEGGDQPVLPDDPQLVVRTTRDVRRGEHLSLGYQFSPMSSVGARRTSLLRWGFVCRCDLCEDPTQRGLHLSSWYCGHCRRQGKESLVKLVDGRWHCEGCGWRAGREAGPMDGAPLSSMSRSLDEDSGMAEARRLESLLTGDSGSQEMDHNMANLLRNLDLANRSQGLPSLPDMSSPSDLLQALPGLLQIMKQKGLLKNLNVRGLGTDIEDPNMPLADMERLLRDASSTLHPTNHAILKLKSIMIRQQPSYKEGIGEARRLADYCRDLLAAADTLMPGDWRLRDGPAFTLALRNTDLMGYVSYQLQRGRRRVWTENKDYIQGLVSETVALLVELKKAAITTQREEALAGFQEDFNSVRKHFPQ